MTPRRSKKVKNDALWQLKRSMLELIGRKREIYAELKSRFDEVVEYEGEKSNERLDFEWNFQFENFYIILDYLWADIKKKTVELYRLSMQVTDMCHKLTVALNERLGLESSSSSKEDDSSGDGDDGNVNKAGRTTYDSTIWGVVGIEHGPASEEFLQMKYGELVNFVEKTKTIAASRKPVDPNVVLSPLESHQQRIKKIDILTPFWVDYFQNMAIE